MASEEKYVTWFRVSRFINIALLCISCGQSVPAPQRQDPHIAPHPTEAPPLITSQLRHLRILDHDLLLSEQALDFGALPSGTHAFNPALLRMSDYVLGVVRIETLNASGQRLSNRLAATIFDHQFRRLQPLQLLAPQPLPASLWTDEDPRLIMHGEKTYVVFNRTLDGSDHSPRRMHLAELHIDGPAAAKTLSIVNNRMMVYDHPDEVPPLHHQKNWSPFSYQDHLCFHYRSNPTVVICLGPQDLAAKHSILRPRLWGQSSDAFAWPLGQVRGGTPAVYLAEIDRYGTFFHSSTANPDQRQQLSSTSYYTGFLTFFPFPPFSIDQVLPATLLTPFWRQDLKQAQWHIQFAEGLIADADDLWVSYGRNDRSSALIRLSRPQLLRRLQNASPPPRVRLP